MYPKSVIHTNYLKTMYNKLRNHKENYGTKNR